MDVPRSIVARPTLLILDSDPAIAKMLSLWAQTEGYSGLVASDMPDFCRLFEQIQPDAAILDADEIDPDQGALIVNLLGAPKHAAFPLVITFWKDHAGHESPPPLRPRLELLPKPFSLSTLKSVMTQLVGSPKAGE